jgi:pimeloyl-ACP methyl ester carboxylesterase
MLAGGAEGASMGSEHARRTTGIVPGEVRLAYERQGQGPLVVFLHGIGGNRSNWDGQLNALGDRFCAIAWDARGYGGSDDPPPPLRFGQFADDVVRLLDHLGAETAHVVGLSMGGMIAQDVAARHPGRLATLALVDTSTGFGAAPEAARREFLAQRLEPLDAGLTPADLAPRLVGALVHPDAPEAVRAQVAASLSKLRTEPYRQALHAIVTTDFRDSLGAVAVPTLVLVGEQDAVTPPAASRDLAARIPGAELVTIPGAGHLANLDQPAAFDRALGTFLDRHADRASRVA